jgi:hypothetical protein
MASQVISADTGPLVAPDGTPVLVLFKAGKNREGYYGHEDIMDQAQAICDCFDQITDVDHVIFYDNASTHLKRPEDALSARKLSMKPSKRNKNFLVERPLRNERGRSIRDADDNVVKEKVRMRDGTLPNGTPQPLYFPDNHPDPALRGLFKGMAQILRECGITLPARFRAQCDKKFSCRDKKLPPPLPGIPLYCCRKTLYEQPDFVNVKSSLQELYESRGYKCYFYPKFHCELNFIEQYWGYAKRVYRMYPESATEADLERNVQAALDSVPLNSIRRYIFFNTCFN